MPQKYKFNERCQNELELIRKCIQSNSHMTKKISAYKKLLIYDEKTIHEILGNDYEKILDKIDLIKKSFTNEESVHGRGRRYAATDKKGKRK